MIAPAIVQYRVRIHAPHLPYRVLVLSPEGHAGWTLCDRTADVHTARVLASVYRAGNVVAAVVRVSEGLVPKIEVVEANVPRPKNLTAAPGFRTVATAL
ncbi:hypothetical protein VT84_09585 [Gemmata sp. SH-PL17]|uniref:hypothetical protein n=1 Tax=Gemmata sp. SH-PL17 TaxID=1630693 RepID=UPI00078EA74F|nr:hypothetical protein [Gemmata sp. SH-PL17]AMV24636.1 hypothetical protein VT84_09585 [Gemmata sp. SH-PL17]